MRAISLVNRIEFQFNGNVARNAITLGDIDNDGRNELIIGNNKGEVAIFKGHERYQKICDLTFVSCIGVGDIFNKRKNSLVVITADGWCYIYEKLETELGDSQEKPEDEPDGQTHSSEVLEQSSESNKSHNGKDNKKRLTCVHMQRIPANAKNIVLGDIDNDGMIEMILGLTDRVVRSYRWMNDPSTELNDSKDIVEYAGKLVALNKWECANQIGSITLHHTSDGKPSLLIAQPGGTFMRIHCPVEDPSQDNFEASGSSSGTVETIPGSAVDYQFLGISRMRNQNISTEILGDFKTNSTEQKKCPYAVATLDGTIMMVQDEVILWAIAVDHQVFALCKLDITGNGVDDIVVCSWDGQTYILDQEKNSVRFHLNESVQAFHCGYYSLGMKDEPVTCLVYYTFKNTIILYYDIPLKELTCRKYEPSDGLLQEYFIKMGKTKEEAEEVVKKLTKQEKNKIIQNLLSSPCK